MKDIFHTIKEIVSFIVIIFVLILLFVNFGTMLYGIYYLSPFIGDEYFLIPIYVLTPYPLLVYVLSSMVAYWWYVALAIIITISLILMSIYGIVPYFRKFFQKPFSYKHNGFQDFAEMLSFTAFFTMVVYFVSVLMGTSPHGIGMEKYPLYFQILQLVHASVYEEILTRFLLLGVPIYLIHMFMGDKISPIRVLGGGYKIKAPEVIFLLFSSLVFGFAHAYAWGFWKVLPAFMAGLAMGYLYLKYGIYASIIFHFTNDFMSVPMSMDESYLIIGGLMFLVVLFSGIVFTVSYTIRVSQYLGIMKKPPKKLPPPPTPPWIPPPPWISIKCPKCGGEIFEYLGNGKLRCVSCGEIIDVSYSGQYHQQEN